MIRFALAALLLATSLHAEKKPKPTKTVVLLRDQKDIERECVKISNITFEPQTFGSNYRKYTGLSGTIENTCGFTVAVGIGAHFFNKAGTLFDSGDVRKLVKQGSSMAFQVNPSRYIRGCVTGLITSVFVERYQ